MTFDLIKFAFIGGEVSESYSGRSDLEKFDLSLLSAENWFVDYLGGLSNVPGTLFCEQIEYDSFPTKMLTFSFASNEANTYIVLFGKGYIRFLQNGAYVLEDIFSGTISTNNPTTFTIADHPYADGDLVQVVSIGNPNFGYLLNQTFKVKYLTTSTFSLLTLHDEVVGGTGGGFFPAVSVARVYTITSPYAPEDLEDLRCSQIRDVLRLTHEKYVIRNLKRYDHTDWRLTEEDFSKPLGAPTITAHVLTDTSNLAAAYVVTAVDKDNNESLPSDYYYIANLGNISSSVTASAAITWTPVTNARRYKVYRTRVVNGALGTVLSRNAQTGYIGTTTGTSFNDNGITPDFTKSPPNYNNPFAPAAIDFIDVINPGSGYSPFDTIQVTDDEGTGFIGYPLISIISGTTGVISGVIILNGGKNYKNPKFTVYQKDKVTPSLGKGAVFAAKLTSRDGVNPAVSVIHQQRQVYGGRANAPLTVTGSRPGQLSNFDDSDVLVASDAYQHELDSEDFSKILHMISTRGGLLVANRKNIWLMAGSQGNSVTATDVQAEPQTYTGTSKLPPLKIGTDIVYQNATGGCINALAYADQYKLYSPTDISILASHLFERFNIVAWAYADEPHRLIHAVRADGTLILITMIKEQEIYAFTRRVTHGTYLDVVSLDEGKETAVYYTIKRKIKNRYVKYIERCASRLAQRVDDSVFLDCALTITPTTIPYNVTFSASSGDDVVVDVNGPFFSDFHGNGTYILRYGLGTARITTFVSAYQVRCKILDPIDKVIPFDENNLPQVSNVNEVTCDPDINVIRSLRHLDGMTLTALVDGKVVRNLTVNSGKITLTEPGSRVTIGIPYKSTAKTMPMNVTGQVIDHKRKRVVALNTRIRRTRGLKMGTALDALFAVKSRYTELLGRENKTKSGLYHINVDTQWDEAGEVYIVQDEPLPATLLGYVTETEIGDDKD